MLNTIEEIILSKDGRGISNLKDGLSKDYCSQAAKFVLKNKGVVMITTGFYIAKARASETDGPPGAIAIGNALDQLGYTVIYVSDKYTVKYLSAMKKKNALIVEFPIEEDLSSKNFAMNIINKYKPQLIISIERCGFDETFSYRNMHGVDFSNYNAKIDYLFSNKINSVGIGDGGNEIGMGDFIEKIVETSSLVRYPSITKTTFSIIASVSNWGGYGLVAALSNIVGENLLISIEEEIKLINTLVDLGAVDGFSAKNINKVDGFNLQDNSFALINLHELINRTIKP
ncbi:MAG: glutamate cyclase domain-containing protein [Dehalococcoidia bacterium]